MAAKRLSDIMQIRTRPLRLSGNFRFFFGNLPDNAQWTMLVYGPSESGKSSFVLKFARDLSRFGNVLYVNSEENVAGGTLQIKARNCNVMSDNIYFLDSSRLDAVKKELTEGEYRYCIIDSISAMAMSIKETLEILSLSREFPKISFIYVSHADKTEKTFIGPSKMKHLVDVAVEVIEAIVYRRKNRFKQRNQVTEMPIFRR